MFDISTEPSGVSRLRYFPDFIEPSRCETIFAELFNEIPWIQRHDIHQGVQAMQVFFLYTAIYCYILLYTAPWELTSPSFCLFVYILYEYPSTISNSEQKYFVICIQKEYMFH